MVGGHWSFHVMFFAFCFGNLLEVFFVPSGVLPIGNHFSPLLKTPLLFWIRGIKFVEFEIVRRGRKTGFGMELESFRIRPSTLVRTGLAFAIAVVHLVGPLVIVSLVRFRQHFYFWRCVKYVTWSVRLKPSVVNTMSWSLELHSLSVEQCFNMNASNIREPPRQPAATDRRRRRSEARVALDLARILQ
jgi:hypothetical protein